MATQLLPFMHVLIFLLRFIKGKQFSLWSGLLVLCTCLFKVALIELSDNFTVYSHPSFCGKRRCELDRKPKGFWIFRRQRGNSSMGVFNPAFKQDTIHKIRDQGSRRRRCYHTHERCVEKKAHLQWWRTRPKRHSSLWWSIKYAGKRNSEF